MPASDELVIATRRTSPYNRGRGAIAVHDAEKMAAKTSRVVNQRIGAMVATAVEGADGPWRALNGPMLRKRLPDGYGVVFRPARGIHTQFMRFPIDLNFLDMSDSVVNDRSSIAPWRFDFTNATAVIEMNAGAAVENNVQPGDQLVFQAS